MVQSQIQKSKHKTIILRYKKQLPAVPRSLGASYYWIFFFCVC